jgi:hypothetical protein
METLFPYCDDFPCANPHRLRFERGVPGKTPCDVPHNVPHIPALPNLELRRLFDLMRDAGRTATGRGTIGAVKNVSGFCAPTAECTSINVNNKPVE